MKAKANDTPLAKLLSERDMRLIDLAKKLTVNKTTVSRWALQKVPADRLKEVSEATGISVHDLRPDLASVFTPETERA